MQERMLPDVAHINNGGYGIIAATTLTGIGKGA
jgi:hypothetical protein